MTELDSSLVEESARRLVPVHREKWAVARARTALTERTARLGAKETASFEGGALWDYGNERARGRHAHGFTFLVDWVGGVSQLDTDEAEELTGLIVELFTMWDARYGRQRENAPEMAFHDETTAQRLLGIVSVLTFLPLGGERRAAISDLGARTAELLRDPEFYGGVNNHGMFQDVALLAWAVLVASPEDPARRVSWELAEGRLQTYFSACFTSEGVHVENTPTYHVMVARYLPLLDRLFTAAGAPSAALYHRLLEGAERYAVHCVTPEGLYPATSDTHRRRLDSPVNLETFSGGAFEYAVTGGRNGLQPAERTVAFPASGYAMTRSAWGDPQASYAYFSCAYNADYHKHSDENSLYLRSGGRDLLVEAGPYGYNWKDPFTKYAYSTAAHNSMMVDGAGLPRTASEADRTGPRAPLNELTVISAEDRLLDVTGTTRRYDGRVWSRRTRIEHGDAPSATRVHLEDTVRSEAGAAELRFLWHLGPGLTVRLRSRGAEILDGSVKVMEIEFRTESEFSLRLQEGDESPSIQGWHFPDFGKKVPAPVISLETRAADHSMVTEVRLADFRWDQAEADTFDTLVINSRTVPTYVIPASDDLSPGSSEGRSVLFLSASAAAADRERYLSEVSKATVRSLYVPDLARSVAGTSSADLAERAVEQISAAATAHIRRENERGVNVTLAATREGFAPALQAALSADVPLVVLDPVLPFPDGDPRAERLLARLGSLADGLKDPALEVVVTAHVPDQADRVLAAAGSSSARVTDLRSLITADVEDAFSDMLLNSMLARAGEIDRYVAVYDRRAKAFHLNLPGCLDVEVSIRVFRGKEEVQSMPYTPGNVHRIPYTGFGPHRLRVHVRPHGSSEARAFTTGVLRVR